MQKSSASSVLSTYSVFISLLGIDRVLLCILIKKESVSHSVMSNSVTLWTVVCHLWDSSGRNTGACCHLFLQEIFPTQGSNLRLPHCRQSLYYLSHQGREVSLKKKKKEKKKLCQENYRK